MSRAYPGDEVFFHFKGEPCCGKVLATGKHGCTVEHGGKQHRLKWEHLAGHKTRAQQTYKVLEQGEDGLIVENQHGKRRFIGIPPEARAEVLSLGPQKTQARSPLKPGRAGGG